MCTASLFPSLISTLSTTLLLLLNFSFLLRSVTGQAVGVGDDHPMWVQGALEAATATDDSYNTGGTITVNGFTMNVPKNLLVQFPAAWVPWKDFVGNKTDFLGFETLVCLPQ